MGVSLVWEKDVVVVVVLVCDGGARQTRYKKQWQRRGGWMGDGWESRSASRAWLAGASSAA